MRACVCVCISPFIRGEGSSTVSSEHWKTMLTVRITNARRINMLMLKTHTITSSIYTFQFLLHSKKKKKE